MATSVFDFRDLGRTQTTTVRVFMDDSLRNARRIPVDELWLWQNPEALASVQAGLAEMGRGETVYLGSFEQYADLDIDD